MRNIRQAEEKLEEMIATETTYVEDLRVVVEEYWNYMAESKRSPEGEEGMLQMPDDLKNGKDEIAIGMPNIKKIHQFHNR